MKYAEWEDYFWQNRAHFRDIDFDGADELTERERALIYSSIQQFQRGENSEGKHLFAYAKRNPYPAYLRCISLFIREEQTHARVLGMFMDKHRITRIKSHWVDSVFRWLRQLAGLENTIRVLLTAEIIAKVYYKALQAATGSRLLKSICRQILQDEDQHIAFQCCTLKPQYQKKSLLGKWITRAWHRLLMTGTILVVWLHHRKVYKSGGYSFGRYFMETLAVYLEAERIIRNRQRVIAKETAPA
jgi:hypothetical protein